MASRFALRRFWRSSSDSPSFFCSSFTATSYHLAFWIGCCGAGSLKDSYLICTWLSGLFPPLACSVASSNFFSANSDCSFNYWSITLRRSSYSSYIAWTSSFSCWILSLARRSYSIFISAAAFSFYIASFILDMDCRIFSSCLACSFLSITLRFYIFSLFSCNF